MKRTTFTMAFAATLAAIVSPATAAPALAPIGGVVEVAQPGSDSRTPSVAPTSNGGFVVAWQQAFEEPAGRTLALRAQRYDGSRAPVGGVIDVVTPLPSPAGVSGATFPQVASDASDDFTVSWSHCVLCGDIAFDALPMARRFSASGAPLTGAFVVDADQVYLTTDVAQAPGGEFVVAWGPGDAPGPRVRAFDAAAEPLGPALAIDGLGLSQHPRIALGTTHFVVAYDVPGASVLTRAVAFDGSPEAIADPGFAPSATGDGHAVAAWPDGEFFVVATERPQPLGGERVVGRALFGDGKPVGDVVEIRALAETSIRSVALAMLADGTALVTWRDGALEGRIVDGEGSAPTPVDLSLDVASPGRYDLAADAGGRVTVVWERPGNAGIAARQLTLLDEVFADGFESGDTEGWPALPPT